jgi:hypothetical protein
LELWEIGSGGLEGEKEEEEKTYFHLLSFSIFLCLSGKKPCLMLGLDLCCRLINLYEENIMKN